MAINKFQRAKSTGDRSPQTNILGKIFKGLPKNGGKVGRNTDYFRFTPKGHNAERLQELWDQFYMTPNGGEPRVINISFPYNNIEWILNEWFCEFGSSGLKTKCDGDNIVGWRDSKNDFRTDSPKPCREPNSNSGCKACKATDLLKFKIFEFGRFGFEGIVELTTGSIHDIGYLRDRVTEIAQTLESIGLPLRGTPLQLYRETRIITKTIGTVTSRGEESLLGLSLRPSLQTRVNEALEARLYNVIAAVSNPIASLSGTEHKALPMQTVEHKAIAAAPEVDIKALFSELLTSQGVDIEFNGNRSFIGQELCLLGYERSPNSGKGDASKIPHDKLQEVADKIVKALEAHNNLNLQKAVQEVPPTPLKSAAFDPNEASQYLDTIASEVQNA